MPDIFVNPPTPNLPPKPSPIVPDASPATPPAFRKNHPSCFSAFALYPDKVRFETKEKEEKVVLFLRQHPLVNVPWILLVVAMLLAPLLVGGLGILAFLPHGFELILILAWYLLTLIIAMENFLDWFFNVCIVTNLRIVDIDFVNLIYKNVSDANINKIQDVSYNMGGVIRTIFNFGDVVIQTAAEIEQFEFEAVPNPARVVKILEDLRFGKGERESK